MTHKRHRLLGLLHTSRGCGNQLLVRSPIAADALSLLAFPDTGIDSRAHDKAQHRQRLCARKAHCPEAFRLRAFFNCLGDR